MSKYDPHKIEKKWQKIWDKEKTFSVTEDANKKKFYALIEFPYPSGAGLHVGHPRPFTAMDVIARKKRMKGFNVLYPIGFDAFGLPTENYAIKTGRPPAEVTAENIVTFTRQLKSLGYSFDWSRQVDTTDPEYFKWTQWIFLQFFKHGLAYKKNQPINWCPKDKIGLANEEVVQGCCERCGTPVEQRNKEQWMLAITKYADKLLQGLKEVDYVTPARIQQENWIGRSEGADVQFVIVDDIPPLQGEGRGVGLSVFTTRPDTIFGVTYVAVSAELAKSWLGMGWKPEKKVADYIEATAKERVATADRDEQEKTGIDTGLTAINPANGEAVSVWITNYVMGGVGTGALMGVPAHDERDFEFAKKFKLPIRVVICGSVHEHGMKKGTDGVLRDNINQGFDRTLTPEEMQKHIEENGAESLESGLVCNSNFLDGLTASEAKEKMIFWLEEKGVGKRKVNFKLRDWVFSRQRYWGEPIPLVFCENCKNKKYNFIIIHGYGGNSTVAFKPWLKSELEKVGHKVYSPDLPNLHNPNIAEQVDYILKNADFTIDENTVLVGHSLGAVVIYKLLEKIKTKIHKAVLVDPVVTSQFNDTERTAVTKSSDWKFDWGEIKKHCNEFVILGDKNLPIIRETDLQALKNNLDATLLLVQPEFRHFSHPDDKLSQEPEILRTLEQTGWIPLPESELPLELPKVKKYEPTDTGESPLSAMADWVNTKCPRCGGPARRETDTMPNWAGSSWYFLRYCDPHNNKEFASMKKLEYWMGPKQDGRAVIPTEVEESLTPNERDSSTPLRSAQNDKRGGGVDWYNGGNEHIVLHLLYSRFWNQFLFDLGLVPTREPYKKRTSHGIILGPDGEKMSKSRGNVINPDEMVEKYGADALRTYIMFMGPFDQAVQWDTNGLVGVKRFLDKVWNLQECVIASGAKQSHSSVTNKEIATSPLAPRNDKTTTILHQTIKKVTEDIDKMAFNTAIAKMMELANHFAKEEKITKEEYGIFAKLVSPFAPHIAEEIWTEVLGHKKSLAYEPWPTFKPELAKEATLKFAVQINGKVRDEITVASEAGEDEIKKLALTSEKVQKWLEGKAPKKVIYVKGKLVSIVI